MNYVISTSSVYNKAIIDAMYSYKDKTRRNYVRMFNVVNPSKVIHKPHIYVPFFVPTITTTTTIVAICSTIHTPSIAALEHAKRHLYKYGIDLVIEFFTSSSYALSKIEYYNSANIPILVTVTTGTAKKLEEDIQKYKCQKLLESIPGYLSWTSPVKHNWEAMPEINFMVHNHPTDLLVCGKFKSDLEKIKYYNKNKAILNASFQQVDFMPEEIDIYNDCGQKNLLLTVDFLDSISNKKFTLPFWKHIERRYVYCNESFIFNETEDRLSKFLQAYLFDVLNNLIYSPNMKFWKEIMGSTDYFGAVKEYTRL